jgi:hypothetical protein
MAKYQMFNKNQNRVVGTATEAEYQAVPKDGKGRPAGAYVNIEFRPIKEAETPKGVKPAPKSDK